MSGETPEDKKREDWFIEQYDVHVKKQGASYTTVEQARAAMAKAYEQAVNAEKVTRPSRTLEAEGRALFNEIVRPERDRRRASFRRNLDAIVDAIVGDTLLGKDDPILDLALAVGDGTDKTLRFWNVDDYKDAALERYEVAAKQTRAADEFNERSQKVIDAMRHRSLATTEQLIIALNEEYGDAQED